MADAARHESSDQRDASDRAAPDLRLRLLGAFQLARDGAVVEAVNAQRRQLLIAYLALQPGEDVERSRLASILWPDSTDRQARTNLRHLLYSLRRALPDYKLLVEDTGTTLAWRSDAHCAVDAITFIDALKRADAAEQQDDSQAALSELQRAIACYAGELLPAHHDDWVLVERERLQQAFIAALERATALLEARRDYPAAIEYGHQLVQADPLHEAGYRTLMRLHALNGDQPEVARVYQACATTLEAELGIEPATETQDLYEALLSSASREPSPVEDGEPLPPLIGRVTEWARLETLWRESDAGQAQLALVSGEAGIGKTRLVEELLAWLRRQGVTVLSARCYSAEGSLSFAPIVSWLRAEAVQATLSRLEDPWLAEVGILLPEIRSEWPDLPQPSPISEGWQRQQMFEALARAILGARQPLMLHIDDLQWCDQDTLEWLRFLLRFQPEARMLVIGTLRPEELTPEHPLLSLFISLQRDGQLAEIVLEPLDEWETSQLAANLVGRPVAVEDTHRLYRETEGNPLFIVEMTRAGLYEDQAPKDLPPTVQAIISERLGLLSEPALEIVNLAAVIGREFNAVQLMGASSADENRLIDALDELSQRRVVRDRGGGKFDFTHDKLREVAYAELGDVRRRMLHRRVADAIEHDPQTDLDAVAARLAYHFEQAGLADRAATYYLHAADQARQVYANHEAIRLYRRGLALVHGDRQASGMTRRLVEGLGDILLLTGEHRAARDAYIQAIETVSDASGASLARLRQKLGNSCKAAGLFDEALDAYAAAEEALGDEPNDLEHWIDIQMDRMLVHYGRGDWQAMQATADVIKPRIERSGTPLQRVRFTAIHANMSFRRERYVVSEEALERIRAAVALAEEAGGPSLYASIQFTLGFSTLWHGDPARATELLQGALDLTGQIGDTAYQVLCLTYLTVSSRRLERIEDTERYARQALELATSADMQSYVAAANANLAWLAWRSGDQDTCERLGRLALYTWKSGTVYPFRWLALWPLIDIAAGRGDTSEAVALARELLDESQQRLPDDLQARVEAALVAGDPREPLRQAVEQARELSYL